MGALVATGKESECMIAVNALEIPDYQNPNMKY
jgi:hypothetical protein